MSHLCDGRDLSCASCAAVARRLDAVRAAMTLDEDLDDVKRARIWTQLEDRLTEVGPVRGSRVRIAIGLAAAAAVAAAGLFIALGHREDRRTLSVPVDTVVTSQLGPHTFASIAGPAELDIAGVPGDTTTIHLRSGSLLVDFAGGAGRALRIEAPRATIDVVGTLFAVAVHEGATCTSVSHGRVRITMPAGVLYVVDGQRYCTGDSVAAIETDVREALSRHQDAHRPPAAIAAAAPATDTTSRPPPEEPRAPAPAPRAPDPTPHTPIVEPRAPIAEPRATVAKPRAPVAEPRAPLAEPRPPIEQPRAPVEQTPQTAPPPRRSPEELYRAAEAALAARDLATADRELAQIVDDYPASPLIDQVLYERARIAVQQRAWAAARSHLARLATIPATPFAEQGSYLRCRVAVESHEPSASACLTELRTAFPRSPHDLDALALLIQLAHAKAGCAGAAPLIEELAERYPRTTLAAAWRKRCPESP